MKKLYLILFLLSSHNIFFAQNFHEMNPLTRKIIKNEFIAIHNTQESSRSLDSIVVEDYNPTIGLYTLENKETFIYDGYEKLEAVWIYEWDNLYLEYKNLLAHSYSYSPTGFTEIVSIWDDFASDWFNYEKFEYHDYFVGDYYVVAFEWDETLYLWQPTDKVSVIYNSSDNFETIFEFEFDQPTLEMVYTGKFEFGYNQDEDLILQEYYNWNSINNSFELDWFYEYNYDNLGNRTEMLFTEVTGSSYFSYWKYTYSYNSNNDLVRTIYWLWDESAHDFGKSRKDSIQYDNNFNPIERIIHSWSIMDSEWINISKVENIYENYFSYEDLLFPEIYFDEEIQLEFLFRHMLTKANNYEWNTTDTVWELINEKNYYYSEYLDINSPTVDLGLSIYPNPFQNNLNIDIKGIYLFELYDAQGSLIDKQEYSGAQKKSIFNLSPGIYFYRIIKNDIISSGRLTKS